jgi:hypothetical protein
MKNILKISLLKIWLNIASIVRNCKIKNLEKVKRVKQSANLMILFIDILHGQLNVLVEEAFKRKKNGKMKNLRQ